MTADCKKENFLARGSDFIFLTKPSSFSMGDIHSLILNVACIVVVVVPSSTMSLFLLLSGAVAKKIHV